MAGAPARGNWYMCDISTRTSPRKNTPGKMGISATHRSTACRLYSRNRIIITCRIRSAVRYEHSRDYDDRSGLVVLQTNSYRSAGFDSLGRDSTNVNLCFIRKNGFSNNEYEVMAIKYVRSAVNTKPTSMALPGPSASLQATRLQSTTLEHATYIAHTIFSRGRTKRSGRMRFC